MLKLLLLVLAIDMQAHMASDEGKAAYTTYQQAQAAYYTGAYAPDLLRANEGEALFGLLNTLMGNTCQLGSSSFSYNTLREAYVGVDRDLNTAGNIIGYYDGRSMNGTWDGGSTYNREHTWPQSKGANKSIPMGHDMQSVRPASVAVNSDRGNTAYGEGRAYYDPDEVAINNPDYKPTNLGTYRGDAARVILYDYLVYGKMGEHQNHLYNGNAQLLDKLGADGVFESLAIILKWHMQDPPSLTEMVRNDGAETYQGNRNPFIDYPELAPLLFSEQSGATLYNVTNASYDTLAPAYSLTTNAGFITYVGSNGAHPDTVTVSGANHTYNPETGRLIITNVSGPVTITTSTVRIDDGDGVDDGEGDSETALHGVKINLPVAEKKIVNGQIIIVRDHKQYDILGHKTNKNL